MSYNKINGKIGQSFSPLMLLIISMIITACGQVSYLDNLQKSSEAEAKKEINNSPTTFYVLGIDISGSYEMMTRHALRVMAKVINRAGAGDEIIIRYIGTDSYADNMFVDHFKLPEIDQKPKNAMFNRKLKRKLYREQRDFNLQKKAATERLLKLKPKSSNRTDIYGFIFSASDTFGSVKDGRKKVLAFATDLDDNQMYNQVKPDLSNVDVRVYAVRHHPDPAIMKAKKEKWRTFLMSCGAISVSFYAPEMEAK